MFIKEAAGRLVRHPITKKRLAEAGEHVTGNVFFWQRRLRDGDIVNAGTPEAKTGPAAPAAKPATPSPAAEAPSAPAALKDATAG